MSSVDEQVRRFAVRVANVRRARGLTQEALAAASGLSRPALAKLETGHRGVGLADAVAVATALDVSVADMLSDEPLYLTIKVPID